jgi:MFS family permease
MLLGLGVGLIFSNGFLLMTEATDPEIRNTAQGMYMTSMGIGFTIGPLIGGYTAKYYGSNISFLISAGFGACSLLLILLVKEKKQKQEKERKREIISLTSIIRDRKVLAAGVANYMNSLMFNALTLFFPVYGIKIGLDESQVGTSFTTRGFASTAIRLPVGSLTKHIRALYLMIFGLTLSALTIFGVSQTRGLVLISTLMGIQGVAYGIYLTSGNVYVASNSDEDFRGTAMAVYSMFGNLSGILNPLILGLIAERLGVEGALQFSAFITLIGVLFVYYLAKIDYQR